MKKSKKKRGGSQNVSAVNAEEQGGPMSLELQHALKILEDKVKEIPDDKWRRLLEIIDDEKIRRYLESNEQKARKKALDKAINNWEKNGGIGVRPGQGQYGYY